MNEFDFVRVKREARNQRTLFVRIAVVTPLEFGKKNAALVRAVNRIANNRKIFGMQMRTDLVGAPSERPRLEPRIRPANSKQRKFRQRFFSVFSVHDCPVMRVSVGQKRKIDFERFPKRSSVHKAMIDFFHGMILKLLAKIFVRDFVPRVQNNSARVLVDSMHGEKFSEFFLRDQIQTRRILVITVGGDAKIRAFVQNENVVIGKNYGVIARLFHKENYIEFFVLCEESLS